MGQAHALRAGFERGGRERAGLHGLDARAAREAEEARAEALGRVGVDRVGLGAEVGAVKRAEAFQVGRPKSDVVDVHR